MLSQNVTITRLVNYGVAVFLGIVFLSLCGWVVVTLIDLSKDNAAQKEINRNQGEEIERLRTRIYGLEERFNNQGRSND